MASPQLDVRVSAPLIPDFSHAEYEIRVTDCTRLLSLTVIAGGNETVLGPMDLVADGNAGGCLGRVAASGGGAGSVSVIAQFDDGASLHHQESFHFESQGPAVNVSAVGITGSAEEQELVVELNVSDNVDISYVDVDAIGLRASDLRAVGGVVSKARDKAFATSNGARRLFPKSDLQQAFVLSLPLKETLDSAAIMSDGVVLIDIAAIDASGNQRGLPPVL